MKKWLVIPLFLLLALVIVLGSCGSTDKTTKPVTTTPPTQTATTTPPTQTATTTPPTQTATTTPPPTTTVPTGTITVASPDFGYESTDPIFYESTWGWSFYESLLRWDSTGKFIGGVADSWSVSDNGCVWTFKIHQGITFWDGSPLTAADVKFSVDRFGGDPGYSVSSNPWSNYISYNYNKRDSIVVDNYTYQFVSDHPEPAQQIVFAWTRILPKAYFESVGEAGFRAAPMGSGPWIFKELVTKQKMTLEANTNYWRTDEIPAYQYYVELMVPEQATRIAMLRNHECDIALGIDYDRLPDLEAAGFKIFNQPGPPGTSSLAIQGSWLSNAGAVGDIRIRQALSFALDREEIVDTWYQGYGDPTAGQFYMYPGCFGWNEALRNDPFDPDHAMALMEAAGYPDSFADPTIHIYTTAAGQDYILLLMGYWQDVGLQVSLEVVDSTIYTAYAFHNFVGRIQDGDANAGWIFTWTFQSFFNCTYHSANMYCSWGAHSTGNDAMADELYLKAANETDPALSAQYFGEFQAYVKTLYIDIGICTFDTLIVENPNTIGDWTGRNWVSYQDALNGIQHPK
ncbi:MAG: ABC transporter substrate-binding protein [Dehalococcoidales bacterium]